FQAVRLKITYATNTWTTPWMVYMFARMITCFINDDWQIVEHIIDFRPLENKEHEGFFAGKVF
ncbi:hypothetical protein L208DRAFT_1108737, partial [Tricholoma matsutake]